MVVEAGTIRKGGMVALSHEETVRGTDIPREISTSSVSAADTKPVAGYREVRVILGLG